jgi:hypothetical protein
MNHDLAVSLRRTDHPTASIERELAVAWARLTAAQVCLPCAHRITVLQPIGVRPQLLGNGV